MTKVISQVTDRPALKSWNPFFRFICQRSQILKMYLNLVYNTGLAVDSPSYLRILILFQIDLRDYKRADLRKFSYIFVGANKSTTKTRFYGLLRELREVLKYVIYLTIKIP